MDYLEDLTVESFAEEVVGYGINEFFKIRHYIFEPNMDVSPYITHVGKAVTVLAILHHRSVNDAMMKVQTKILRSYRTLEIFVNCFAERFFQLRDPYPPRFMLIKILTFCGVIVAMGDFCYRHGRSDFVQVCVNSLEVELEVSLRKEFQALGGWESLYHSACPFVRAYDMEFGRKAVSKRA